MIRSALPSFAVRQQQSPHTRYVKSQPQQRSRPPWHKIRYFTVTVLMHSAQRQSAFTFLKFSVTAFWFLGSLGIILFVVWSAEPNTLLGSVCWRYDIRKICFSKQLKRNHYFYNLFSKYPKLLQNSIKCVRLARLKFTDDDLKLRPMKFCKYVSTFRKNIVTSVQLRVDGTCRDDPADAAEVFPKNFHTTCRHISLSTFTPTVDTTCSELPHKL